MNQPNTGVQGTGGTKRERPSPHELADALDTLIHYIVDSVETESETDSLPTRMTTPSVHAGAAAPSGHTSTTSVHTGHTLTVTLSF